MQTLAPSSASARTIALPIPVLPPVTMADFPFKLMVPPRSPYGLTTSHLARYVQRHHASSRPLGEDEREPAQHDLDRCRPCEERRERDSGFLQLATADRSDAVPHLIEGDHARC